MGNAIVATLGLVVAAGVAYCALPTNFFMLLIAYFLTQANWEALQSMGGWRRMPVIPEFAAGEYPGPRVKQRSLMRLLGPGYLLARYLTDRSLATLLTPKERPMAACGSPVL